MTSLDVHENKDIQALNWSWKSWLWAKQCQDNGRVAGDAEDPEDPADAGPAARADSIQDMQGEQKDDCGQQSRCSTSGVPAKSWWLSVEHCWVLIVDQDGGWKQDDNHYNDYR